VVIVTPCPLLLAIPTAIIGAISLAARRAIIIKNPAALERIEKCRTLIFHKTGTLTYGRPNLTEIIYAKDSERAEVLRYAASVEQYSKHSLAIAVVMAAKQEKIETPSVDKIREKPGDGSKRDNRPEKSARSHATVAGIGGRPGVPDVCGGPIHRGVPLPRCAAQRQRLVHRAFETETRGAQGDAGFR
jgi:magnesium-transporting ATPase (P-type)